MISQDTPKTTPIPPPLKDPRPNLPDLQQRIGDLPKERETTASKKVDDISKHESRHSLDPKRDPKHNARDKAFNEPKVSPGQAQGDASLPGTSKK